MSVYFIHAEAVLNNGCVAQKIGRIAIADSAVTAFDKFFSDDAVAKLRGKVLMLSLINSKRWSDGTILVVLDSI